jgi:hypothetical protein
VTTGGNAEASTLGIRNELARAWETAHLAIDIGALRAESSTATRTAVGASPASFQVTTDSVSALTAESYFARGRYDREISARTFWYGGTGWERNTFAGIENRYSWGGGLGNTWVDNDRMTFKTAYGVSYTVQDDVVETAGGSDSFAGLQVSYDYSRQLTSNAGFTSVLVADENLDETADFRTDFTNAVTVSMSNQLALKVSWQMLYDRQPSLVGLPLIGLDGLPTGDTVFVVFFIAGSPGMPPMEDVTVLDGRRRAVAWGSFALLALILLPLPHAISPEIGLHCPYL